MPLFDRRPKIAVSDFCREFYDSTILGRAIEGVNPSDVYLGTIRTSLAEADPRFGDPDDTTWATVFRSAWFEMFGTAWTHEVRKADLVLAQVVFTRTYLREVGLGSLWEAGKGYSLAVGQSSAMLKNDFSTRMLNGIRVDLYNEWVAKGVDPECAARAANREGTNVDWEKGPAMGLLSDAAQAQFGFIASDEASFGLQAVIYGFYTGARQAISAVRF